jgi:glycosyltransferase involved in cell wall biosynthesis
MNRCVDLTIIIPVYNEADNIKETIEAIEREVVIPHIIFIVYDMVEDTTIPVVNLFYKNNDNIKLIKNLFGSGGLNAIRTGLKLAQGKYAVITMADLSDPPKVINEEKKLPVALIGKYRSGLVSNDNFLQGEVLGHSSFEWVASSDPYESTERGLAFMKSLGINYDRPDLEQMEQARASALLMPDYPSSDSIKYLPNMIVIKLSESTYTPQ